MAVTVPTDVDSSILEVWAQEVLRDHKYAGFWGRFVGGAGSGAPIIQRTELLNKPGDLMHIQVTNPLSGAGVSGDTAALTGNEEKLTTSAIKASPLLYRHAVRVNRRADKKSIVDLLAEAKMRLSEWGANKMDTTRFSQFNATSLAAPLGAEAYTPNIYVVNGGTGVDDVAVGDKLNVASLQAIKTTLLINRAKPLMVDGFPHFVLVTHPYTTYDLKQETRYESWVRDALQRGESNPFFRGALAVVDGMIIYEHPNVTRVANATSVQVSKGIAFGAEAFVEALDENTHSESESFDYGLEWGISYEFAFQPRRALELSSLQVYAASTAV